MNTEHEHITGSGAQPPAGLGAESLVGEAESLLKVKG